MQPILENESVHLFTRFKKPEVGDIVVFSAPCEEGEYYVKRVAAGPGETVEYLGQQITLGQDEFFVLGDNRAVSNDSRFFGPIDGGSVVGVMIL